MDIEDLKVDLSGINEERKSIGVVSLKTLKSTVTSKNKEETVESADFYRPGQASVYVKTWGCGHNNSDGEYMAGLLSQNGYDVVLANDAAKDADVWLLNSCTVKGPSEQTFANDIQKGIAMGKKVVVAGCVPQGDRNGDEWKDLSIIGVQQIDQVVRVVEETLKGNTVQLLRESKQEVETEIEGEGSLDANSNHVTLVKKRKTGGASLDLPKIRRNPYIEIIPVNTGCLNQCTYCKTKHARGDLGSYYPEEIIRRVSSVLDEGVLEIWLTSEDIGAYGRDIDTNIVKLVWGIIDAMESHPSKNAMLRIGMTNPPYILEHLSEMCKILNHPRVYAFLHVPVQAGSTRVLDEMRRQYTIEDFEKVCDTLLESVPNMTLATDIICGFPTETEQDFDETIRVLEKYKFSVLHISQFYPRPGTPAALMKRISTLVVKNRSRRATTFFESYTSYSHLLNTTQSILVTETSTDGKHYVGHNKSFHQILVPKDPRIMGQWIKVYITETSKWYMKGRVLTESIPAESLASVSQNRIPKLVRDNKKMVIIEDVGGAEEKKGHRKDGSILSLGANKSSSTTKILDIANPSASAAIDTFRWMELIVGGIGAAAFLLTPSIKPGVKAMAIAVGAVVFATSASFPKRK